MMEKNTPITKVAAAQLAPVFLDTAATVAKTVDAMVEAAKNGAQLVAFPETFIPGYPYWALVLDPMSSGGEFTKKLFYQAIEVPGPEMEILCEAAKKAGIWAVVGINERSGGTLYNSQVTISDQGEVVGLRRKLVPTSHERLIWGRGDGSDLVVIETPFGTLGALICYEHSNALFRYALQGQGEMIHVANWPGGLPWINPVIDAATRHYAFEAQAFVISVTAVLTQEMIDAMGTGGSVDRLSPGGGYSGIIGPRGNYLAEPENEGETILYADLDMDEIVKAKLIVDSVGHYARPDVVRLVLNSDNQAPIQIEGDQVED